MAAGAWGVQSAWWCTASARWLVARPAAGPPGCVSLSLPPFTISLPPDDLSVIMHTSAGQSMAPGGAPGGGVMRLLLVLSSLLL
ncbi:hypothetical protein V8C86DRAFT_2873224 [Haematococcus lacustris]